MTTFIPPLAFMALFAIGLMTIRKIRHDKTKRQLMLFAKEHSDEIVMRKESVRCETNVCGRTNTDFKFTSCDLYFLPDTFVIVGYRQFGRRRIFVNFLELSNGYVLGKGAIKKVNLNSFGNDVYIEFGEASFSSTNVEIRLKGLSEAEKQRIRVN